MVGAAGSGVVAPVGETVLSPVANAGALRDLVRELISECRGRTRDVKAARGPEVVAAIASELLNKQSERLRTAASIQGLPGELAFDLAQLHTAQHDVVHSTLARIAVHGSRRLVAAAASPFGGGAARSGAGGDVLQEAAAEVVAALHEIKTRGLSQICYEQHLDGMLEGGVSGQRLLSQSLGVALATADVRCAFAGEAAKHLVMLLQSAMDPSVCAVAGGWEDEFRATVAALLNALGHWQWTRGSSLPLAAAWASRVYDPWTGGMVTLEWGCSPLDTSDSLMCCTRVAALSLVLPPVSPLGTSPRALLANVPCQLAALLITFATVQLRLTSATRGVSVGDALLLACEVLHAPCSCGGSCAAEEALTSFVHDHPALVAELPPCSPASMKRETCCLQCGSCMAAKWIFRLARAGMQSTQARPSFPSDAVAVVATVADDLCALTLAHPACYRDALFERLRWVAELLSDDDVAHAVDAAAPPSMLHLGLASIRVLTWWSDFPPAVLSALRVLSAFTSRTGAKPQLSALLHSLWHPCLALVHCCSRSATWVDLTSAIHDAEQQSPQQRSKSASAWRGSAASATLPALLDDAARRLCSASLGAMASVLSSTPDVAQHVGSQLVAACSVVLGSIPRGQGASFHLPVHEAFAECLIRIFADSPPSWRRRARSSPSMRRVLNQLLRLLLRECSHDTCSSHRDEAVRRAIIGSSTRVSASGAPHRSQLLAERAWFAVGHRRRRFQADAGQERDGSAAKADRVAPRRPASSPASPFSSRSSAPAAGSSHVERSTGRPPRGAVHDTNDGTPSWLRRVLVLSVAVAWLLVEDSPLRPLSEKAVDQLADAFIRVHTAVGSRSATSNAQLPVAWTAILFRLLQAAAPPSQDFRLPRFRRLAPLAKRVLSHVTGCAESRLPAKSDPDLVKDAMHAARVHVSLVRALEQSDSARGGHIDGDDPSLRSIPPSPSSMMLQVQDMLLRALLPVAPGRGSRKDRLASLALAAGAGSGAEPFPRLFPSSERTTVGDARDDAWSEAAGEPAVTGMGTPSSAGGGHGFASLSGLSSSVVRPDELARLQPDVAAGAWEILRQADVELSQGQFRQAQKHYVCALALLPPCAPSSSEAARAAVVGGIDVVRTCASRALLGRAVCRLQRRDAFGASMDAMAACIQDPGWHTSCVWLCGTLKTLSHDQEAADVLLSYWLSALPSSCCPFHSPSPELEAAAAPLHVFCDASFLAHLLDRGSVPPALRPDGDTVVLHPSPGLGHTGTLDELSSWVCSWMVSPDTRPRLTVFLVGAHSGSLRLVLHPEAQSRPPPQPPGPKRVQIVQLHCPAQQASGLHSAGTEQGAAATSAALEQAPCVLLSGLAFVEVELHAVSLTSAAAGVVAIDCSSVVLDGCTVHSSLTAVQATRTRSVHLHGCDLKADGATCCSLEVCTSAIIGDTALVSGTESALVATTVEHLTLESVQAQSPAQTAPVVHASRHNRRAVVDLAECPDVAVLGGCLGCEGAKHVSCISCTSSRVALEDCSLLGAAAAIFSGPATLGSLQSVRTATDAVIVCPSASIRDWRFSKVSVPSGAPAQLVLDATDHDPSPPALPAEFRVSAFGDMPEAFQQIIAEFA